MKSATRTPDWYWSAKQLAPAQDYEINYLQGRLLLREGLSSLASSSSLILSSTVGGNPQYLVVTYEYVPGFSAVNNLSTGGKASVWVNDYLQLGATTYRQGEAGTRQTSGRCRRNHSGEPKHFLAG